VVWLAGTLSMNIGLVFYSSDLLLDYSLTFFDVGNADVRVDRQVVHSLGMRSILDLTFWINVLETINNID
jgi:hypothetical protein